MGRRGFGPVVTNRIELMAEEGELKAPMEIRSDPDAEGGAYIVDPGGEDEGEAVYDDICIPNAGRYAIWMRVQHMGDDANSFRVFVNDEKRIFRFPTDFIGYAWHMVGAPVRLGAGSVNIRVRTREPNARLDEIMLTQDLAFNPNVLSIEAEDGDLMAPMQASIDTRASRDIYIADENGGGAAAYTIPISRSGVHNIWMRVQSLGGGANSFFIKIGDDDEDVLHISPSTSNGYIWILVASPELEAGKIPLLVRTREKRTRLDRIIVTDDLTFDPDRRIALLFDRQGEGERFDLDNDGDRVDRHGNCVERGEMTEGVSLTGSMNIELDEQASGCAYIVDNSRARDGAAVYTMPISTAGTYRIWMRVESMGGGSNSFHVVVNGDSEVFHISPATSNGFIWREARRVELDVGELVVEVRTRERNTRLDRIIVVSDDLQYNDAFDNGEFRRFDPNDDLYVARNSMIQHDLSQVLLLDHEDTNLDFDVMDAIPSCPIDLGGS